jgi:hypothetical protein
MRRMPVDSVQLRQFTVFEDARITFCPGVNVILGTNGTGKSHAMKAAYAALRAMEQAAGALAMKALFRADGVSFSEYPDKLLKVFRPEGGDLRRLIRRGAGAAPAEVAVVVDGHDTRLTIEPTGVLVVKREPEHTSVGKALFLPSREILSMFDGFLAAYTSRELSFDETYYDACLALSASILRGERYQATAPLRAPIEKALGGPVVLDGSRFHIRRPDGDMEPHLLAEGWRRLAALAHLIANGSIAPGTAFFWDEPEAGLNPRLVVLVADLLLDLAARGVQVFIATHDYLLSRRLSVVAEYGKRPDAPTRFFLFHRADEAAPVTVAAGSTLAELPEDPILAEFTRHYDFERDLFQEAALAGAAQ